MSAEREYKLADHRENFQHQVGVHVKPHVMCPHVLSVALEKDILNEF